MMHQLIAKQYSLVSPLIAGLENHLSVQAVIEGTVEGQIWVDNPSAPRSVWFETPEGQYLAGAATNLTFLPDLAEHLLPWPFAHITCSSADWEAVVAALLAGKFVRPHSRQYFVFHRLLLPDWQKRIPPGHEVALVDAQFLARQDLNNIAEVQERISEWRNFVRDGFGYCIVRGHQIVSTCLTDCTSGTACEIGVVTQAEARHQGLATVVVAATVAHALAQGFTTIGWHCWATNRGSQRVAEKVGLILAATYTMYATGAGAENAADLTTAEWQAQAAFCAHAAGMLKEQSRRMEMQAAQAHALAGDDTAALTLLQRLVDSGKMPTGWATWRDFQALQMTPAWADLLAHAQTAETGIPPE